MFLSAVLIMMARKYGRDSWERPIKKRHGMLRLTQPE